MSEYERDDEGVEHGRRHGHDHEHGHGHGHGHDRTAGSGWGPPPGWGGPGWGGPGWGGPAWGPPPWVAQWGPGWAPQGYWPQGYAPPPPGGQGPAGPPPGGHGAGHGAGHGGGEGGHGASGPAAGPGAFPGLGNIPGLPPHLGGLLRDDFTRGLLIGAAATFLLTNPKIQKGAISSIVQLWDSVQGGFAEMKERFHDAEAEIHEDGDDGEPPKA